MALEVEAALRKMGKKWEKIKLAEGERRGSLMVRCGSLMVRCGSLMVSTSACHARGRFFDSRTRLSTLETVYLWCLSDDTKSRWSLLSGVYARGSKRSHTGGKCITCLGLHILA